MPRNLRGWVFGNRSVAGTSDLAGKHRELVTQHRDLDVSASGAGPRPSNPSSLLTTSQPSVCTTTTLILPDRSHLATALTVNLHPSRYAA
jgi:hypothetical protein